MKKSTPEVPLESKHEKNTKQMAFGADAKASTEKVFRKTVIIQSEVLRPFVRILDDCVFTRDPNRDNDYAIRAKG